MSFPSRAAFRASAPAAQPGALAPQDHDWVMPPASPAQSSATLALHQTHVNSSVVAMMGGRTGARGKGPKKKKKGGDADIAVGNDGRLPWVPRASLRSYEITTVETLPSTTFLTGSLSVPTFAASAFTVNQVQDFASFSNVFDQYRIVMIEVLIEPQMTEITSPSVDPGEFVTAVDLDDANTPSAYADVCSYTTSVQTRGIQNHYHRWAPGVAVAVYSGTFTSFASTTSMWLDCGSPNIQHYGLKAAAAIGNVAQAYVLTARMHVQWRTRH